jgi:hypothetical protein
MTKLTDLEFEELAIGDIIRYEGTEYMVLSNDMGVVTASALLVAYTPIGLEKVSRVKSRANFVNATLDPSGVKNTVSIQVKGPTKYV